MNDTNFSSVEAANHKMRDDKPHHLQYRTVSKAAVISIVFAILGILAFLFPAFVLLPFLSICFGFAALFNFKRFPDQLSGRNGTQIAMLASAVILVASIANHAYIYATEVPEGYQRISFYDLNPKPNSENIFSKKSANYDGEKVFLKGYVRPGLKEKRLKKFILVGDFGSCCFGGDPKITDVVAVTIENEDEYVNYGYRLRRIGGEFKLHKKRPKVVQEKDLPYVIYEIKADHIK